MTIHIVDESEIRPHGNKKNFDERKCIICGNVTQIGIKDGYERWHRREPWNKNCCEFLCHKCWTRHSPDSPKNARKDLSNIRNETLDITHENSLGILIECTIAKVRKLEVISLKTNMFNQKFDLTYDIELGIIQSKGATYNPISQTYGFSGLDREYDTAMLFCMDKNIPWKNIEMIYVIPKKYFIGKPPRFHIYKNSSRGTWYDNPKRHFRINIDQYDNSFHDLMSHIGDRKYIGVEILKEWLNDKYGR